MTNHAKSRKEEKRAARPMCACVSSCETIFVIFPHLFNAILAIIWATSYNSFRLFDCQCKYSNFNETGAILLLVAILHGRNWPLWLMLLPSFSISPMFRAACAVSSHVWWLNSMSYFGHILAICQSQCWRFNFRKLLTHFGSNSLSFGRWAHFCVMKLVALYSVLIRFVYLLVSPARLSRCAEQRKKNPPNGKLWNVFHSLSF